MIRLVLFIFIVSQSVILWAQSIGGKESSELVDLGLPSGILWMNHNLGAAIESDFGEYYNQLADTDMVTQILGSYYTTPTREQFQELIDNTLQKWVEVNNVRGMQFVASNGNWIFLPAAASLSKVNGDETEPDYWTTNNKGMGAYWTRTFSNKDYAYFVEFGEDDTAFFGDRDIEDNRLTIRPVFCENSSGITDVLSDSGHEVKIFTLDGVLVQEFVSDGSPITVPHSGVYIVRIDGKGKKIFVK